MGHIDVVLSDECYRNGASTSSRASFTPWNRRGAVSETHRAKRRFDGAVSSGLDYELSH